MTLTRGRGPFGAGPAGCFNFSRSGPPHVLFWDPSPKRVRAVFAGEAVVDSRQAKLLHETGLAPVWYFPLDDVRTDLLVPTNRRTTCPFKGEASYWSITVGARTAANAVWGYPEPLESARPLAGHVALYGDAVDAWFEEDDLVSRFPRDPYQRVDVRQGSQHVRVRVGSVVVAETTRPLLLFETGKPVQYYLPQADVSMDLLQPSLHHQRVPLPGPGVLPQFRRAQRPATRRRGMDLRRPADPWPTRRRPLELHGRGNRDRGRREAATERPVGQPLRRRPLLTSVSGRIASRFGAITQTTP